MSQNSESSSFAGEDEDQDLVRQLLQTWAEDPASMVEDLEKHYMSLAVADVLGAQSCAETVVAARLVAARVEQQRDRWEQRERRLRELFDSIEAPVVFWACPVSAHRERDTVTVEWTDGVARCTHPDCTETSA